ncbi:PAS domain S-box protein [Geofilum rubicundum]|uniref:histidine kinase n=1 Tax=Geofilum rubicundum JCM 15548 TaxID=1236989 RepID=A0A0E9LVN7_9BACT|nr:PAS domain S-box protein [Geofilum rubicundum]GAO29363.1 two-component system sensor histidine kinase [Geofilum rubicundum JCM 15548]
MSESALKQTSEEELNAENRKLRHLLNKVYNLGGESGGRDASCDLSYYLPLTISRILTQDTPFDERIQEVLKYLGEFTAVSRAYVFENSDDNLFCSNTYEWCETPAQSQMHLLQKIDYKDVPSWKKLLEEKGSIEAYRVETDLPQDLTSILESQSIKSILVFPLTSGSQLSGFIGFDECSFHRRWLEVEKVLLATVARLVSNAFQQRNSIRQIRQSLQTKQFLFDIASLLNKAETLEKSFSPIAEKITKTWNLEGFALYYKNTPDLNHFEMAAYSTSTEVSDWTFPLQLTLPAEFPFITLPNDQALELCQQPRQAAARKAAGFSEHSCLVAGIRTYNGPNGIMVLKWSKAESTTPLDYQLIETISGMIARQLDHRMSEISNRRHHEKILSINEQLAEKEQFLNNIIKAAPIGILLVKDRIIHYLNDKVTQSSGYEREELIGKHFSELYYPQFEDDDRIQKFYSEIVQNGVSAIDVKLRKKTGEPLFYQVTGTPGPGFETDGYFLLIGQDMTQIKAVENDLIDSEERNRKIIETNVDGIFIISQNNQLVYVNKAGCDLTGYHQKEITTLSPTAFFPSNTALKDYLSIMQKLREGDSFKGDTHITHKNGSIIQVEVNANVLSLHGSDHFYFNIHDITKRKQTEIELLLAKEKAEAADRLKSSFLANMSHEIRTPLNAIVGFSNLLGETEHEHELREEFVSLINTSADSLMAIINDVIDLSKIESGFLEIKNTTVGIDSILRAIHANYQRKIEKEQIEAFQLHLELPRSDHETVYVNADQSRLLQVINYLMDNAFKFIERGHITLGFELLHREVRIFVKDTGIGISPDKQSIVFEAFRQEDETHSKKHGGTGLGLALCKKLTEAMGGRIGLVSEKGKGSEFFLTLNQTTPVEKQAPKIQVSKPLGLNIPNWNNRMILLVDDNSSVHMQMKKLLEKTHITILSARSGAAARQLLMNRKDIDAVIMNDYLPDIEPANLANELRAAQINIPLFLQSGDDQTSKRDYYRQKGFTDCVNEPILSNDIYKTIGSMFEPV